MNEHDSFSPPLPPPSGDVCPNCQSPIDFRANFCANCGAKIKRHPRSASGGFLPDLAYNLVSLGLVCLAIFFGLGGSCAAIILALGGPEEIGSALTIGAIALVGLGVAWICGKAFLRRIKDRL